MSTLTPAEMSQQVVRRMAKAMDNIGLPALPVDRAKALAPYAESDPAEILAMLRGHTSPSLNLLIAVCEMTRQPVSHFTGDSGAYSNEVRAAKPLFSTLNNEISFRCNPEFQQWDNESDPGNVWSYLLSEEALGFGVVAGDVVLSFNGPQGQVYAEPDHLYLLWSNNHSCLFRCIEVQGRRSSFEYWSRDSQSVAQMILPIHANGEIERNEFMLKSNFSYFGMVVQTSRYGRQSLAFGPKITLSKAHA